MNREQRKKRNKEIVKLRKENVLISEIAQKFQLSVPSVTMICQANGVKREASICHGQTLRVIAHYQQGMSQADIQRKFGMTRQRVSQIILAAKKAGIQGLNSPRRQSNPSLRS